MLIQLATGSHLLNFLFNAFKTQAGAFNVGPLDRSRSTTTYGVRCEDNLTSSLTKTFQMLLKRFSSFSSSQLHRKKRAKMFHPIWNIFEQIWPFQTIYQITPLRRFFVKCLNWSNNILQFNNTHNEYICYNIIMMHGSACIPFWVDVVMICVLKSTYLCLINSLPIVFVKKMGQHRPLFHLCVFKQTLQILQQICMWKIVHPVTTRPGLPPQFFTNCYVIYC